MGRSDRQVDFDREFGGLVDALVAARGAPAAAGRRRAGRARVTDLAGLAAELLPGAAWVAGRSAGRRRPIAWVRVLRARVPAFDALEPGDLVIASASALAVVAPGAAELRDLVAALAAVPVSGVLLVGHGAEPPADGASARGGRPGHPRRADRRDRAGAERRRVHRRAAARSWSGRRRCSRRSSGAAPWRAAASAALVATVSGFLGRALALEAGRGEPRSSSTRPRRRPRAAADAARYQAKAADERRRAARPAARRPPARRARSWCSAPSRSSELARVALPRVAGLLALELAREEAVRGAADRARRAEPMPSAGPPWVVLLARQREPGAEDDSDGGARRPRGGPPGASGCSPRRAGWRSAATPTASSSASSRPGGAEDVRRLAEQVGDRLGRTGRDLARRSPAAADRPGAEAEARSTLEAALALDDPPRARPRGPARDLPDAGRAAQAARRPAPGARAVLEPLLDARPDVRRERLETLRALLAHGGVGEAAAALGVHRNTVAYRLRRIEAATGWRLADPELRLPLAVALGLVQDDQV